jgi:L-amino acid N-acyltransferase YncA
VKGEGPVEIRRATKGDVTEIAALVREVAPVAFRNTGSAGQLAGWLAANASASTIDARVQSSDFEVLVARKRGSTLVGTGYLELTRNGKQVTTAYIGGLYFRVRRAGYGTRMMSELVALASEHGARSVGVTVGEDNKAMLHIVDRLGFELVETTLDRTGHFTGAMFHQLRRPLGGV